MPCVRSALQITICVAILHAACGHAVDDSRRGGHHGHGHHWHHGGHEDVDMQLRALDTHQARFSAMVPRAMQLSDNDLAHHLDCEAACNGEAIDFHSIANMEHHGPFSCLGEFKSKCKGSMPAGHSLEVFGECKGTLFVLHGEHKMMKGTLGKCEGRAAHAFVVKIPPSTEEPRTMPHEQKGQCPAIVVASSICAPEASFAKAGIANETAHAHMSCKGFHAQTAAYRCTDEDESEEDLEASVQEMLEESYRRTGSHAHHHGDSWGDFARTAGSHFSMMGGENTDVDVDGWAAHVERRAADEFKVESAVDVKEPRGSKPEITCNKHKLRLFGLLPCRGELEGKASVNAPGVKADFDFICDGISFPRWMSCKGLFEFHVSAVDEHHGKAIQAVQVTGGRRRLFQGKHKGWKYQADVAMGLSSMNAMVSEA